MYDMGYDQRRQNKPKSFDSKIEKSSIQSDVILDIQVQTLQTTDQNNEVPPKLDRHILETTENDDEDNNSEYTGNTAVNIYTEATNTITGDLINVTRENLITPDNNTKKLETQLVAI